MAAVVEDGVTAVASSGSLNGRVLDCDTRFRIGCLEKPLVAALILQLQHEQVLDIHDVLTNHLSHCDSAALRGITLEQLLCHTSGLRDYPLAAHTPAPGLTKLESIIGDFGLRTYSPPGELFSYCTLGYLLLEAVIEAATGVDFIKGISERLLAPLGIGKIGADPPDFFRPSVGRNISLTCGELAHFLSTLLGTAPGHRPIPPTQLSAVWTTEQPMPASSHAFESWSLGWGRVSSGVFGHNSAGEDGRIIARFEPDSGRVIVAVASYTYAPALAQSIARNLFGANWVPVGSRRSTDVTADCVGLYRRQRGGVLEVHLRENVLQGTLEEKDKRFEVLFHELPDGQFLLTTNTGYTLDVCSFVKDSEGSWHMWNGLQLDSRELTG